MCSVAAVEPADLTVSTLAHAQYSRVYVSSHKCRDFCRMYRAMFWRRSALANHLRECNQDTSDSLTLFTSVHYPDYSPLSNRCFVPLCPRRVFPQITAIVNLLHCIFCRLGLNALNVLLSKSQNPPPHELGLKENGPPDTKRLKFGSFMFG